MVNKNRVTVKNLIRMFIVGLFIFSLINIVSADIDLGGFKQNECIELRQTCDSCTYVNLSSVTRTGANSTTWYLDDAMTKNGVDYNYTFCNTSINGDYTYSVYGDKDGSLSTESGYFQISPSGFFNTLGFYILLLVLSLGIVFFGYYAEDATIVILGAFGLGFIGLYLFFNGIDGIKDSVYTQAISFIMIALSAYLLFRASTEYLN